ncbi:MAG TPA: T9SS type A sorting domain-containing protein, partial [Flavobacterium sp.]|nr:T9SS type A sorting domain-containing protein [Flavobacterium sp.]
PPAGITVTKQLRAFSLNDFAGQLAPNTTYNVRVRLVFNNADPEGPFGKTCSITTPGSAREEIAVTKNVFSATAYPNPFADSFNLDVTTANTDRVKVKVYDMTGRLLEVLDTEISEVKTLQVGDRYPSGVYNVIVSQGDEVKTLRVIKR